MATPNIQIWVSESGSSQTRNHPAPIILRRPILVLALVLSTAFTACRKPTVPVQAPPAAVTVAKPIPKRLSEWDEFTGRLGAVASVEVRARVSGYLQSTHFKEGSE